MGHVKPDGETAAEQGELAVWKLWKQLIRYFPSWNVLPSGLYTPGAWGYTGVDFISGFRRNRSTRQSFELLKKIDGPTFDGLSALADLNARRQEQMLRAVIIVYLTVPLTVIAVLAEVAGDGMLAFVREHMTVTIQVGAAATLAALSYFLSHWRSRQIVGVLDLIRIERSQEQGSSQTASGTANSGI